MESRFAVTRQGYVRSSHLRHIWPHLSRGTAESFLSGHFFFWQNGNPPTGIRRREDKDDDRAAIQADRSSAA